MARNGTRAAAPAKETVAAPATTEDTTPAAPVAEPATATPAEPAAAASTGKGKSYAVVEQLNVSAGDPENVRTIRVYSFEEFGKDAKTFAEQLASKVAGRSVKEV